MLFLNRTPQSPDLLSLPFHEDIAAGKVTRQERQEHIRNRTQGRVKSPNDFQEGDKLLLRDKKTGLWDTEVTVAGTRKYRRSYNVKDNYTGRYMLRNRKYLKYREPC